MTCLNYRDPVGGWTLKLLISSFQRKSFWVFAIRTEQVDAVQSLCKVAASVAI